MKMFSATASAPKTGFRFRAWWPFIGPVMLVIGLLSFLPAASPQFTLRTYLASGIPLYLVPITVGCSAMAFMAGLVASAVLRPARPSTALLSGGFLPACLCLALALGSALIVYILGKLV